MLQEVAMTIKPSAAIRQNYNEISEYCKKTGEPVYLTKNGEGDLVVMDIDSFVKREKMLTLREKLLVIERDRLNGAKYYSIEELEAELSDMIQRAEEGDVAAI
jgi:prevent-host-death family protein